MNSFEEGKVLLIDKPLGWTSFDVIGRIRKIVNVKKVGHAGTLDPLATGLLIVCTGKFTKRINEFMGQEKEYTGTITLGAVTPTYDLESDPEDFKDYSFVTEEKVREATAGFVGNIMQLPPAHSAIKVNGKRLYELARKGKEVQRELRPVTVSSFEIVQYEAPVMHFKIVCGTGTYIRSIANDIGAVIGCGGYLSSLQRTRIGDSLLVDAITPQQLQENMQLENEG